MRRTCSAWRANTTTTATLMLLAMLSTYRNQLYGPSRLLSIRANAIRIFTQISTLSDPTASDAIFEQSPKIYYCTFARHIVFSANPTNTRQSIYAVKLCFTMISRLSKGVFFMIIIMTNKSANLHIFLKKNFASSSADDYVHTFMYSTIYISNATYVTNAFNCALLASSTALYYGKQFRLLCAVHAV